MTRESEDRPRGPRGKPGRNEDPRVYEALGRAIKTARTERGIERKELAVATDLSYAYLSDIESGRRRPSSKAIFAIAQALDMSPSELMRWTEQLTYRIASEESLAEAEAAPAGPRGVTVEAPAAQRVASSNLPASPGPRRSWFEGSVAEELPAERTSRRSPRPSDERRALAMSEPSPSIRAEVERILDSLGPEDLALVLDLADRLAREHLPRR